MVRSTSVDAAILIVLSLSMSSGTATPAFPADSVAPALQPPIYQPAETAVSSWQPEAASHLDLTPDQSAAFLGPVVAARVPRCIKLNNDWCIKKAGWNGEIAADGEGHVAFASAVEGAAVAALLLKRYYVDFDRKTALEIISHWAPAQCGGLTGGTRQSARTLAPRGLRNTLRARWLASHARGFATPVIGRRTKVRHSVVANHMSRMMPTPKIAAGLGEASRPTHPMTLDALLMSSPDAPPSRSMLGMPRRGAPQIGSLSSCGFDSARIATYAATAAAGIAPGPGGDLGLFAADGTPTPNLAIMMMNMTRVEIGPYGATAALIADGIGQAFRRGRNPDKSWRPTSD